MEIGRSIDQSQYATNQLTRRQFLRNGVTLIGAGSAGLLAGACAVEQKGPGIQIAQPQNLSEQEAINKMKAEFAHVNPDIVAAHRQPAVLAWDRPIMRPKTARVDEWWWNQRYATVAILTPESEAPILGGHTPRVFVTTQDNRLVRAESLAVQAAMNIFPKGDLTEDVRLKRTIIVGIDSGTIRKSAVDIALAGLEVYFQIDKPNSIEPNQDSKRRYTIHGPALIR